MPWLDSSLLSDNSSFDSWLWIFNASQMNTKIYVCLMCQSNKIQLNLIGCISTRIHFKRRISNENTMCENLIMTKWKIETKFSNRRLLLDMNQNWPIKRRPDSINWIWYFHFVTVVLCLSYSSRFQQMLSFRFYWNNNISDQMHMLSFK